MNIVIITASHMTFAPYLLSKVIRRRSGQIRGIVLIRPRKRTVGRKVIKRAGLEYFLLKGFDHVVTRVKIRSSPEYDTPARLARQHGITTIETPDVNDPSTLDRIRSLEPDVVLSAFAPQIFGSELIGIPGKACINIHPSLLPKYGGISPIFWCLVKGEEVTGVTIHHISEQIDEGDIFLQKRVGIEPADTVRSLYTRVCRIGADLLLDALDLIERDEITRTRQDLSVKSYYRNPNKRAYAKLKKAGRRLF